jgi:hypothetical protein
VTRRRLVFFTTADPGTGPGPAGQAYHFATVAGPSSEIIYLG